MKLPKRLILELTPKCNYNCPFCYCLWHEFPELAKGVLTFEQWCKVINFAVSNGCKDFLLTGGEPLLRHDLYDLIQYAAVVPGVKLELFTNASRMTEAHLQFFKQHNVRLATSLQGLRTYAEMTGTKRKFYKTIEFISRCRELNFPCSVGITATNINYPEIEDIVSAAAFAGAETIQVSVFMDAGRGKSNPALALSRRQWTQLKKKVLGLPCGQFVAFCDEFKCNCMSNEKFICPAGTAFGTVSPNGVYRKCLHYYQHKSRSLDLHCVQT